MKHLLLLFVCCSVVAAPPQLPQIAAVPVVPPTTEIILGWTVTNVQYLTGYSLTWLTNGGVINTNTLILGTNSTQVTVTNLPLNIPVTFSLRAFNDINSTRVYSSIATLTWFQQLDEHISWFYSTNINGPWIIGGEVATKTNVSNAVNRYTRLQNQLIKR